MPGAPPHPPTPPDSLVDSLRPLFHHPPSEDFVTSFLSTQKTRKPPFVSLLATAKLRLLNSDITTSLSSTKATEACFPPEIHDATKSERRIHGPIPVQVLDVQDLSKSRWSLIEEMEMVERGETTKGREVIRLVPTDEQGDVQAGEGSEGGMCKLLLQDRKGKRAWGVELRPVKGVKWGMGIGTKILLTNISVARGVILLEPDTTTILGGKIEGLHKQWMDGRKESLRKAIESQDGEREGG